MNDCPDGEVRDALPDFVNETLSGDARSRVEQHVAMCTACAAEVELLRTVRAALRSAPAMDVNRIAGAVRAAGAERMVARGARRSPARLAAMAVAAGIVAIALVSRDEPRSEYTVTARPIEGAFSGIDSAPAVVAAPSGVADPGAVTRPITPAVAAAPEDNSLALGTHVGDLEENELVALLESVSQLDALPTAEPAEVEIESITTESQS